MQKVFTDFKTIEQSSHIFGEDCERKLMAEFKTKETPKSRGVAAACVDRSFVNKKVSK
jgi:hypothetical protein